jgi:hypothetical protein
MAYICFHILSAVPESNLLAQFGVLKALESMTRTAMLNQNIGCLLLPISEG